MSNGDATEKASGFQKGEDGRLIGPAPWKYFFNEYYFLISLKEQMRRLAQDFRLSSRSEETKLVFNRMDAKIEEAALYVEFIEKSFQHSDAVIEKALEKAMADAGVKEVPDAAKAPIQFPAGG